MPFKSEKQRKWMHANEPEMAKKWEKKEKKMKRVKELIKKMVREELAEMNEVRIPFSSSHIKQLKRAFKDMKGTLPDNNPLVQKIVQLLKGQDKKVLQQLANADIKYLSDKAKDILGEALNSSFVKKMEKAVLKGKDVVVYDKKGKKYSMQSAFDGGKGVAVTDYLGSERTYQELPMSKVKKIVIEGTCGYGENGELGEEPAGPHLIKKKLKEAKETIFDVAAKVMKDKQAHGYKTKKGLVTVDMQTANLLTKVFKKVNPKMKKILSDIGYKSPTQLMNTLWAVVK